MRLFSFDVAKTQHDSQWLRQSHVIASHYIQYLSSAEFELLSFLRIMSYRLSAPINAANQNQKISHQDLKDDRCTATAAKWKGRGYLFFCLYIYLLDETHWCLSISNDFSLHKKIPVRIKFNMKKVKVI